MLLCRVPLDYIVCQNSVTAALHEPYPGWIEGLNGPTGLMIAAARGTIYAIRMNFDERYIGYAHRVIFPPHPRTPKTGVVRSMHCNPEYPADVIPVDTAINAIIAAAWDRGLRADRRIRYCNVTLAHDKQLTWGESIERGKQLFYKHPLCFALWYPDGSIKSNYWHHLFCVVFFHYLPAYFIDALCVLFRKKPL